MKEGFHVLTGALGYTGKSVAERLIEQGVRLRTLTNSQDRPNPFGDAIDIKPLAFDNPDTLTKSLEGADVLYNTYWVRFKLSGTSLLQRKKSMVLCEGYSIQINQQLAQ